MAISLTGDGLVDNLYHFIWKKDAMFETGPYVLMPDTILYRFENPVFWYFTSKQGKILKKNKKSITNKLIEEQFLRNVSPSGIVAVYIHSK